MSVLISQRASRPSRYNERHRSSSHWAPYAILFADFAREPSSHPVQPQINTCPQSHNYRRSCWHMPKQLPWRGAVMHSGRVCFRVVWLAERATRARFRVAFPVQKRLSSGTRAQASYTQPRAHLPLSTRLVRVYWLTSGHLIRRGQSARSRRRTAQGCAQGTRLAPRGLLSAPVRRLKFFPHKNHRPSSGGAWYGR